MISGMTGHERAYKGNTNVWLTPKDIIDSLGPFDLDPCACSEPRPWSTADKHYTVEDDGLSKVWEGLVWMNPPYGPDTRVWMRRLKEHGSGIALVFARTETRWFQESCDTADLFLFPAKRITFCKPDGVSGDGSGGCPSVLIAYGQEAVKRLLKSNIKGMFLRRLEWRNLPNMTI